MVILNHPLRVIHRKLHLWSTRQEKPASRRCFALCEHSQVRELNCRVSPNFCRHITFVPSSTPSLLIGATPRLRRRDCAAGSTSMPAARAVCSRVENAECCVYGDGETVVDGERAHARRCSAASSQVPAPQPPQKSSTHEISSVHFKHPTIKLTKKMPAGLSAVNAHQFQTALSAVDPRPNANPPLVHQPAYGQLAA